MSEPRNENRPLCKPLGEAARPASRPGGNVARERAIAAACPACGSLRLQDIRAKLVCTQCHTIIETCCEGGRG